MTLTDERLFTSECVVSLIDHWQIQGGARDVRPHLGPNFFNFMQFLGKIGKNNRLAPPPLQLLHAPLGNPGSAAVDESYLPHTVA